MSGVKVESVDRENGQAVRVTIRVGGDRFIYGLRRGKVLLVADSQPGDRRYEHHKPPAKAYQIAAAILNQRKAQTARTIDLFPGAEKSR